MRRPTIVFFKLGKKAHFLMILLITKCQTNPSDDGRFPTPPIWGNFHILNNSPPVSDGDGASYGATSTRSIIALRW